MLDVGIRLQLRRSSPDARDDTSTVVVLTSKPALPKASAAASAFAWCRSASTTCLPALTRRAIAWSSIRRTREHATAT
jgi:hypothetical protein